MRSVSGLLAGFAMVASAARPGMWQEADGLTVYSRVTTANSLAKHFESLPKSPPIRAGKEMYHALVAVFDSSTEEYMTHAIVKGKVSPLGRNGATIVMHPSMPRDKMGSLLQWVQAIVRGDLYEDVTEPMVNGCPWWGG